jgi:dolichol-phosphate mannosyltransferase
MTEAQVIDKDVRDQTVSPVLAIIPTYNERDNLPKTVARVRRSCPDVDILVVDDGSPDGTGDLADAMSDTDPARVHVLHRAVKEGLGPAYLAGFTWGMSRGYAVLVEMDADGSHPPEQLHRLLDAVAAGADLAIGSRYVRGGQVRNWPMKRKLLSRTANLYARCLLGGHVKDITAGYRAYRRGVLETLDLSAIDSRGYCFQIDLTWRALAAGFDVVEVPITFVEREFGASKMSGANIREALMKVSRWGMQHKLGNGRSKPAPIPTARRTT